MAPDVVADTDPTPGPDTGPGAPAPARKLGKAVKGVRPAKGVKAVQAAREAAGGVAEKAARKAASRAAGKATKATKATEATGTTGPTGATGPAAAAGAAKTARTRKGPKAPGTEPTRTARAAGAAKAAVQSVKSVKAARQAAARPPLLRTTDRLVLPPHPALHIPDTKVVLSTASVYPATTAVAFELAAKLGYDGVEVMVWNDPVSQDVEALRRLSDAHRMPVLAVHAPCLLITQRVWSTDPWTKLVRARAAAEKLGASAVVVHPPFRWQRQYAREFVEGIHRMAGETDVRFAVENMYPWRYKDREMLAYAPGWDVTEEEYRHFTIDLSHVATSRVDAFAMVERMGDRLAHIHLADGSGSGKDEHLIPGRGKQPCAELLEHLARTGFDGHVVLEVNTRRSASPAEREADLAEALAFTRLHLATPARVR
ncbi:Sugar phosphate isomerase/epimerase [Streptomyces sp. TLI_053]|nr:Sugar phosphate isomerase/epimerase [Streptomyces sp. TLI_053]